MVTGLGGGEYDKKPPLLVFDVYNLKVKWILYILHI